METNYNAKNLLLVIVALLFLSVAVVFLLPERKTELSQEDKQNILDNIAKRSDARSALFERENMLDDFAQESTANTKMTSQEEKVVTLQSLEQ